MRVRVRGEGEGEGEGEGLGPSLEAEADSVEPLSRASSPPALASATPLPPSEGSTWLG